MSKYTFINLTNKILILSNGTYIEPNEKFVSELNSEIHYFLQKRKIMEIIEPEPYKNVKKKRIKKKKKAKED